MSAIDRSDYSLSGLLPVVPRFDFHELATIEAPAQWEALAAIYDYETRIAPITWAWSVRTGWQVWERNKPWYCNL